MGLLEDMTWKERMDVRGLFHDLSKCFKTIDGRVIRKLHKSIERVTELCQEELKLSRDLQLRLGLIYVFGKEPDSHPDCLRCQKKRDEAQEERETDEVSSSKE